MKLEDKVGFIGIGFGKQGVPIDVVGLFLAGLEVNTYFVLLVDEFLRINGMSEDVVDSGFRHIKRTLKALSELYSFEPEIILCSEFMRTQEYASLLKEIKEHITEKSLDHKLMQTVPEKYRESGNATAYSTNEIACVEFLRRTKGIEVKIGPSKEKIYDKIMQEMGIAVGFAYVLDAYALGTKEPEEVVHYVPTHRGNSNGQRLCLEEPIRGAKAKLIMGPEEASRYLLKLATIAGQRLGMEYLTEQEIESLHSKRLKKVAMYFVVENILKPYKGVVKDDF